MSDFEVFVNIMNSDSDVADYVPISLPGATLTLAVNESSFIGSFIETGFRCAGTSAGAVIELKHMESPG